MTALAIIFLGLAVAIQTIRLAAVRRAHRMTSERLTVLEAQNGTGHLGRLVEWLTSGSDRRRSVELTARRHYGASFEVKCSRWLGDRYSSTNAERAWFHEAVGDAARKVGEL